MLTTGFKYFFGAGALLLVAGIIYAWTSGGVDWDLFPGGLGNLYFALLGGLTLGWRGAVGDHLGYTVLLGAAASFFLLGGVFVAFRDGSAASMARAAGTDTAPIYRAVGGSNYYAPLGGIGLGLIALGLATGPLFVGAGLVLLALLVGEWMMSAWADRATGDHAVNTALRDRIMRPFEIPIGAALAIGAIVLGFSRALLTVSELGSVIVVTVLALVIFGAGIVLAASPKQSKGMLTGFLALAAVVALAAGVIGVANGEREFHLHETEHSEEAGGEAEHSEGGADEGDHSNEEQSGEGGE